MTEPKRGLIFEGKDDILRGEFRVCSVYLGRVNFRRIERSRSGAVRVGRMYSAPIASFEGIIKKIVQEAPEEEFTMPEIEFEIPKGLPKELTGRALRIRRY